MKIYWNQFAFFLLNFLITGLLNAQSGNEKFWISFKDKAGSSYSLDHPEAFLSSRSLQRRARQNIDPDESDLPVSSVYTDSLKKLGIQILYTSKWLNGAVIKSNDQTLLDTLESLNFIIEKKKVYEKLNRKSLITKFNPIETRVPLLQSVDYEYSREQIQLCNGQFLHEQNFRGEGMLIGILDAGFYHAQTLPAFSELWEQSRVKSIHNFVDDSVDPFEAHPHGMYVLSIIGGKIPGTFTGSAPNASFLLLRSEDTGSEFPVEEDNWVVAAEYADSMGVDVINSSLGYSKFDDPEMNHTYADLDGKTTHVTLAAGMAASKGILVVNSAGNEGNKNWHYIIAPADAPHILAVGAVDSLGRKASFSSFGPSADGRVKPDVSAMGVATAIQGQNGNILRGNGTSFSSPVIAGLSACLWQAFPGIDKDELIHAILASTPAFFNPSNDTGYGIPDFSIAYQYLKTFESGGKKSSFLVFPNPFNNEISILIPTEVNSSINIEIINILGEKVRSELFQNQFTRVFLTRLNKLQNLAAGSYIIKISFNGETQTKLLIKQ